METLSMNEIITKLSDMETHLGVLNGEMGEVVVRLAVLETQMDSIQWLLRLILGAVVLAIVGSLMSVVLIRKNSKSNV